MCCFTFASYSILINGVALGFFHVERGLRQGFPLSTLVFLLVMKGLSRLLINSRAEGSLGGVLIFNVSYLSHLLFVDGVLVFLNCSFCDTYCFNNILTLFCKAIDMEPTFKKSTIIFVSCLQNEERYA